MIKQWLNTKTGWVAATVASVVFAGSIATVSAARDAPTTGSSTIGYTIDQCKNGGWEKFKNPDGSQQFKNQGQCVAFFATAGSIKNFQDTGDRNTAPFWSFVGQVFQAFSHWWTSLT